MNQVEPAAEPAWRRLARLSTLLATGCYSAILLFATHYPKPERLVGGPLPSDKLLHFLAYGVLGLLIATTLVAHGRLEPRVFLRAFAVTAVAAILDEITQPIFGRAAEPLDWVFDCIGLAVGFGAVRLGAGWLATAGLRSSA